MTVTDRPQQRRHPRLGRDRATRLAATEYDRMVAALRDLAPEDWARPTDCPGWDVRQLACHMVGMAAFASSPAEIARQQRRAQKLHATRGGALVDALTEVQVEERAGWGPDVIVAAASEACTRGLRGRRIISAVAGRAPLPGTQSVNGQEESWTVGYLLRTILSRDPWMHRADLAAATGRSMTLTAEHDGALVADVVAEWAARHGRPYRLELTGPAGGSWRSGEADPISMDAVEFCRVVSGRGEGSGLLTTQVPF